MAEGLKICRNENSARPALRCLKMGLSNCLSLFALIQSIPNFHEKAKRPSYGIAETDDARSIGDKSGNDKEVQLTKCYKANEHDCHGTAGISPAAQGASQYVIYTVKHEEEDVCADEQHAEVDNGRIRSEQADGCS